MLTRTEKKAKAEKKSRKPVKKSNIILTIFVIVSVAAGVAYLATFASLPYSAMQDTAVAGVFYLTPMFNGFVFPEWLLSWVWIPSSIAALIVFIAVAAESEDNDNPHPFKLAARRPRMWASRLCSCSQALCSF